MSKKPFYATMAWNKEKICKNCKAKARWRVSGYCESCSRRNSLWGHPGYYPMKPNEYSGELGEVRSLVGLNSTHSGLSRALAFCDDFLDKARSGAKQVSCADALLGLMADKRPEPEEVLIQAAALTVLYNRGSKIKSLNNLVYVTGNRILRLRRLNGPTSGRQHREVGLFIRNSLGPVLLLNIAKACGKRLDLEQDWLKKQGEELRIG